MTKLTDGFSIAWRGYNAATTGCLTHAVEPKTDNALCGVVTVESAGQTLTDTDGHVGCRRCLKALQKRGIIPPPN